MILAFRITVRVRRKDGSKYSLNIFAMSVLLSACSLSLSFSFIETFPGMLLTFDFVLKKGPKAFWIVITRRADCVHVFKVAVMQHLFNCRAEAFKFIF